ncbi:MAG: hypothetical protein ACOX89_11860 [Lutispora sp.]
MDLFQEVVLPSIPYSKLTQSNVMLMIDGIRTISIISKNDIFSLLLMLLVLNSCKIVLSKNDFMC